MNKNLKELEEANWGKIFGWHIEYEGQIIGELLDYKWFDMFWDSYIIVSKNDKWNEILTKEKLWNNSEFKFKNKKYNQYAKNALSRYVRTIELHKRIIMRGLYLGEIE